MMFEPGRGVGVAVAIALAISVPQPGPASTSVRAADDLPLLRVMAPTGTEREGLPVYTAHPNGPAVDVLSHGFSGRLLRLYRWEQRFLARRNGRAIEPAYLLLSTKEGGFPRFGFWLDGQRKDGVGHVDLHERLIRSSGFGALDQIFPHELLHVIVRQLAGPPAGPGGANQVHAIGVRTDRIIAFHEGFAEHAQVMAVDDLDARPATAALAASPGPAQVADERLRRYRRAVEARWALAPASRMAFVLWFSQTEQVLRYHAVKANRFAREPPIDLRRFGGEDLYAAYLLENTLPGEAHGPFKTTARLLATEGARWS
jgi:hypothetical protein